MSDVKRIVFRDENIVVNHSVHELVLPEEFNAEPHIHDMCELLYLKKGNPRYFVEGKDYKLSKNTLIISRPGDRHRIYFDEPSVYERYNILYDEKKLPEGIMEKIPKGIDIINFDSTSIVNELFKKTDYYAEHFEGSELSRVLCSLTEEIFYNAVIFAKDMPLQVGSASSNRLVATAIDYINENLTTVSGLDEICDMLYITKSHLHHLFIKHLQISPKKYILMKKLDKARKAIRSGKRPVDIYIDCGFSDYSTFYRDYKNVFGHSPSKEPDFIAPIVLS